MRPGMKRLLIWLVLVVAASAVAGSCADEVQELSSYWENHDFRSLDSFKDIDAAELKFEGFVDLLEKVPHDVAAGQLTEFLDSAALNPVAYTLWAGWFEAYFHAIESPFRNDALCGVFLDKVLDDEVLDEYMLEHLRDIRSVLGNHAEGMPAADVALRDVSGRDFLLSDLRGKKVLLLLLDADCTGCVGLLEEAAEEYYGEDVHLLAILLGGTPHLLDNISARMSYSSEKSSLPWILSWCPSREIEAGEIYDLTMVPSRVLLSSDGIVIKSYHLSASSCCD